MTKKTNDAAANDAADVKATALPASLVQTAAVDDAAVEHPKAGGSYIRQADGTLVPNEVEGAAAAEEPVCHFDVAPPSAAKA